MIFSENRSILFRIMLCQVNFRQRSNLERFWFISASIGTKPFGCPLPRQGLVRASGFALPEARLKRFCPIAPGMGLEWLGQPA
jgi:hypothetical protein